MSGRFLRYKGQEFGIDPWQQPYSNQFDKSRQSYTNESSNAYRSSLDRSRPRNASYGVGHYFNENKFNSANKNYRNRKFKRRSLSAPRTTSEEDGNTSNWNSRQNSTNTRNRRVSISNNPNYGHSDDEGNLKNSNNNRDKNTSNTHQIKKFRTIFGPDNTSAGNQAGSMKQTNSTLSLQTSAKDKDQTKGIANIEQKNTDSSSAAPNIIDFVKRTNRNVMLKSPQENNTKNLSKYYGESLTELNKEILPHEVLPVINWSKESFTIENLPEYDSNRCVGGDGLTLEVFYLCKYCQMFTGGCQIDAHLKSRYHYDRYREFLKSGEIPTDASLSASDSFSECDSKMSKTPTKQGADIPSNQDTAMEIDDPEDIVYRCHQELDFD